MDIALGIGAGILALAAVLFGFDKFMLRSEERRRVARQQRPEGTGPTGAASGGAFGVGFEVWQPGYKNYVDEQQRQENWIEQQESGAPPRDVDLDRGVATIRLSQGAARPEHEPDPEPDPDPDPDRQG